MKIAGKAYESKLVGYFYLNVFTILFSGCIGEFIAVSILCSYSTAAVGASFLAVTVGQRLNVMGSP